MEVSPMLRSRSTTTLTLLLFATMLPAVSASAGLPGTPQPPRRPQDVVVAMINNENAASDAHERWVYLSNERSGRTGGHVWTERVVETPFGRMRRLLAIDGKPLAPAQQQQETERLENLRQHPDIFIKKEQGNRAEEKRAREMLEVLPHDFIFDNVVLDHGQWRMSFHPDPNYQPNGIEERILHNMAGTLVIGAQDLRLIHMDFHLIQDVPIGFGLLADVHTGTTFVSDRQEIDGCWHTMHVSTQVKAKAIVFKSVDMNVDVYRSDFHPLTHDVSVPEAASMLLAEKK